MTDPSLSSILDLVRLVADVAIIPLCKILWDMQKRLSHIEGELRFLRRHRNDMDNDDE